MALHWLLAQAAARSRWLLRLVEGSACCLAPGGEVDDRRRKKFSASQSDLDEALHQAGLDSLDQAREVVLEPSGKLIALRRG